MLISKNTATILTDKGTTKCPLECTFLHRYAIHNDVKVYIILLFLLFIYINYNIYYYIKTKFRNHSFAYDL